MPESESEVWHFDFLTWVDYMSEVTRQHNFHCLQKYCTAFKLRYLMGRNDEAICKLQRSNLVHLNTLSNGELSDPVCDSVNRSLTLVWLIISLYPNMSGFNLILYDYTFKRPYFSFITITLGRYITPKWTQRAENWKTITSD